MFNFGNANEKQREAISTSEGPVLITAGPGTGKTYTLVQRTLYLIKERGVRPENILIATFTEKAAKELVTRISNELNVNEMYIGTFHSLCLRFLKEHLENTRLRKNFRLMDAFDQQYLVFQNLKRFKDEVFSSPSSWVRAGKICSYVNKLSEELISPEKLINDDDVSIAAIGRIFQTYNDLLAENNLLDFSSIMAETFRMLSENREVLEELRSKITYIMVDEYQDTNNIQEQIIFLLAGNRKNICVVGDDDQGLYRFRGATIRNILEFPKKFKPDECRIIPLVMNYRSNDGIINFYNRYMSTPLYFQWDGFRYEKTIQAAVPSAIKSPTVVKISGFLSADNWHKKIFNFIQNLKNSGKLTDYNQIAFLFRSVKNERAVNLANFLESNGINVYSPRSSMFFMR